MSSICAIREIRNTKLKQTILSSVQIDPYTKRAVFSVIVRSYTRRLAAFSRYWCSQDQREKAHRQEKKYAGGLVRLSALYSSRIFSSYFFYTVPRQAECVEQFGYWAKTLKVHNLAVMLHEVGHHQFSLWKTGFSSIEPVYYASKQIKEDHYPYLQVYV